MENSKITDLIIIALKVITISFIGISCIVLLVDLFTNGAKL